MKLTFRRLLLLLAGLGLVGLLVYALQPQPVAVDLAPVTRGELLVTVDEDGKTRIKKHSRHVLAAPLEGHLLRIKLEAGDPVRAGEAVALIKPQPPALLDARAAAEARARVRAAEAARKKAEAQADHAQVALKLAQQRYARGLQLVGKNTLSREEFDALDHNHQMAREELKAAQASLQVSNFELELAQAALLRVEPGNSVVRSDEDVLEIPAPLDGQVLKVLVENETIVTQGKDLIEVGDATDLEIEVDVLSADAVRIKPGAKVFLEQWGGPVPLRGTVWRVEPGGFLKISALGVEEQRVWVIIHLNEEENAKLDPDSQRRRLGDAYRVEARIVAWEGRDVLRVQAGALFRHGDGWAAFAERDGKAVLCPVDVGHTNGVETEVVAGLAEGDRVVLHPSDKIADGVPVYAR